MAPGQLPPAWTEVALSDVAEVRLGRQRSPKNHTGPHMRPYLRAANVTWAGLDLSDVKEMNFEPGEAAVYALRPGDVVMSEASGSIGEAGKPALWREEIPGCCLQNTLIRLRPTGGATPEFLYYVLYHQALRGGWTEGTARGVGIHHLGSQRVAPWRFALPPLAEQTRLVGEIERRLSRLIAGTRYVAAAGGRLEVCRAAIHNAAATGQLGGADVQPEKWPRVSMAELAMVQGGIQKQPKRRPLKNTAPFLRVANVNRGSLDLNDVHRIEVFDGELDRFALEVGDLLVVEGNGSPSQIGRAALWDGSIEHCVHQNHLIRIRPGPRLIPEFLAIVWNAPEIVTRLRHIASSTSGLYTLSTAKVKSVPVPVPPLDEQKLLIAEVDRRSSLIDATEATVRATQRRAGRLRQSILRSALDGLLAVGPP